MSKVSERYAHLSGVFVPRGDEEHDTDATFPEWYEWEYDAQETDDLISFRVSERLRAEREAVGIFHVFTREVI